VLGDASSVLEGRTIEQVLEQTGAAFGRPWQKDHRVAMAAAIAASGRRR
jgi:hypothetical protein